MEKRRKCRLFVPPFQWLTRALNSSALRYSQFLAHRYLWMGFVSSETWAATSLTIFLSSNASSITSLYYSLTELSSMLLEVLFIATRSEEIIFLLLWPVSQLTSCLVAVSWACASMDGEGNPVQCCLCCPWSVPAALARDKSLQEQQSFFWSRVWGDALWRSVPLTQHHFGFGFGVPQVFLGCALSCSVAVFPDFGITWIGRELRRSLTPTPLTD